MIEVIIGGAAACVSAGVMGVLFLKQNKQKTILETTLALVQKENQGLQALLEKKEQQNQALLQDVFDEQKRAELSEQKLESQQQQLEQWKKDQDQHLERTRASILKAGSEMSSKLLDDHKRESEIARVENEKRVQQVTEQLQEQFKQVSQSMHTLYTKMVKVEVIERALLSPQGAGALSEIALENIFKSSGLTEGQDYILQHWLSKQEGGGNRPDAVVFLPKNQILVVDSKASKFFMEHASIVEGEDSKEQKKKYDQALKQTMQQHLKDLSSRNYLDAMHDQLHQQRPIEGQYQITVMMFLPTEVALEKLRGADKNFEEKAWAQKIIPIGPAGLVNALLQSRQMIAFAVQEKSQAQINNEIKKLLGSIGALYGNAENLGDGIKSLSKKYDKFAASFNGNFLMRARKLREHGLVSSDSQNLKQLERYQVISAVNLLEGESLEEIENIQQLENIKTA